MCEHMWVAAGRMDSGPGCEQPVRLVCRACGESRRASCGTANANKCAACGARHRDRVARVAGSGLHVGRQGLFVTVTAPGRVRHRTPGGRWCPCTPEGGVDLDGWNVRASAAWNRLLLDLSRQVGADLVTWDENGKRHRECGLTYFRSTEVQRRGALHFHVLIRRRDGRPLALSDTRLRSLAMAHGFGHAVKVLPVEDGHAAYVAKYAAKAAGQRVDVPWRRRRWIVPPSLRSGPWVKVRRVPAELTDDPVWMRAKVVRTARGAWWYAAVDLRTGEVLAPALEAETLAATYRTWSASRDWGRSMGWVRAAQQHYVLCLELLPDWRVASPRPAWALAVPLSPDRPLDPVASALSTA